MHSAMMNLCEPMARSSSHTPLGYGIDIRYIYMYIIYWIHLDRSHLVVVARPSAIPSNISCRESASTTRNPRMADRKAGSGST